MLLQPLCRRRSEQTRAVGVTPAGGTSGRRTTCSAPYSHSRSAAQDLREWERKSQEKKQPKTIWGQERLEQEESRRQREGSGDAGGGDCPWPVSLDSRSRAGERQPWGDAKREQSSAGRKRHLTHSRLPVAPGLDFSRSNSRHSKCMAHACRIESND